jgi:glycosyltransferase involved in cell wall biosynthesis
MLLTHRLYYHVKPLVPRRLRLALRRNHVRRIRKRCGDVWPIKKGSERPPANWPGWPDSKRFAFVLTHDVEGQHGVDRVKQLAELEMELGFRSSFNFIPEGEYRVPAGLRAWLTDRGFEVGVHDLHHDGKLYSCRDEFLRKAQRINSHLKEWNATGFRSGFMLHNLNWIRDLDIQYDASTFDTDPFEPQPDGVDTIFPFWVTRPSSINSSREGVVPEPDSPRQLSAVSRDVVPSTRDSRPTINHSRSGYVELPYTLPQDSTLFNLLRESTIDIWKTKLDWIAQNGGMALLNLHPDYINFNGSAQSGMEFPAHRYRQFLEYVNARYDTEDWRALPREVASFCEPFQPLRPTRRPKNICVLAYSHYESDSRIVRYAKTLAQRGDHVDVVAYAGERDALGKKDVGGVRLYKIQRRSTLESKGPLAHLLPLLRFFAVAGIFIARKHFHRRYDLIHVHNIPEWLVFAVSIPKLFGARILLDIHDLVPELFSAKFKTSDHPFLTRILKAIERCSCQFADHVIISNDLWKERLVKRSVLDAKCSVFFNNIDPELFFQRKRMRQDERQIVIFPGSLQWHQGVDIAIKAFPRVLEMCPTAEFHIYGEGGVINELKRLVRQLRLEKKVLFCAPVTVDRIPQLLADSDAGVVPKRNDSFGNEAYSTKIMEFMSQGVPVAISRTAIDTFYFNDSEVRFCEPGNPESFAAGIIDVLTNESLRERLVRNSLDYVTRNHWGSRKQDYIDLVDSLIGGIDADLKPVGQSRDASPLKSAGDALVSPAPQCLSHV